MTLTREVVDRVAGLARLGLTDEEKELFRGQLSAILDYAEVLNRLDTDGTSPMASVLPLRNVMRPDEARPSLAREDVLANAPRQEDGQFRVPAVLE